MTERNVLTAAALGNLAAILPGAALADGTGGAITPDPQARPLPRKERPTPEHDPRRPPPEITWQRSGIGVSVRAADFGLEGFANVGGQSRRLSPGVIQVPKGGRFRIEVFFHVDAENMPRPQPFQPPQLGIQWYYTPDGGDPSDTVVLWDPAPEYSGPGKPLTPRFDQTVGFAVPESGWLTLSARIDDPVGSAEFDDTIRLLVDA